MLPSYLKVKWVANKCYKQITIHFLTPFGFVFTLPVLTLEKNLDNNIQSLILHSELSKQLHLNL